MTTDPKTSALGRVHTAMTRALDAGATGDDLRDMLATCVARHKRTEKLKREVEQLDSAVREAEA